MLERIRPRPLEAAKNDRGGATPDPFQSLIEKSHFLKNRNSARVAHPEEVRFIKQQFAALPALMRLSYPVPISNPVNEWLEVCPPQLLSEDESERTARLNKEQQPPQNEAEACRRHLRNYFENGVEALRSNFAFQADDVDMYLYDFAVYLFENVYKTLATEYRKAHPIKVNPDLPVASMQARDNSSYAGK